MRKSVTHFGTILSSCIVEGRTHFKIVYNDRFQKELDSIELSRRQYLYYKEGDNNIVGQQKQKVRATLDDNYVGTRGAFQHYGVAFYGTVKRCFVGSRQAKNWHIMYNNKDSEDVLLAVLRQRQKLYAKEGIHDPVGNPN